MHSKHDSILDMMFSSNESIELAQASCRKTDYMDAVRKIIDIYNAANQAQPIYCDEKTILKTSKPNSLFKVVESIKNIDIISIWGDGKGRKKHIPQIDWGRYCANMFKIANISFQKIPPHFFPKKIQKIHVHKCSHIENLFLHFIENNIEVEAFAISSCAVKESDLNHLKVKFLSLNGCKTDLKTFDNPFSISIKLKDCGIKTIGGSSPSLTKIDIEQHAPVMLQYTLKQMRRIASIRCSRIKNIDNFIERTDKHRPVLSSIQEKDAIIFQL